MQRHIFQQCPASYLKVAMFLFLLLSQTHVRKLHPAPSTEKAFIGSIDMHVYACVEVTIPVI